MLCSYVEDSSLKSTEITVVGNVSEGAQTSTTLDKSKVGGGRLLHLHLLFVLCINECNFQIRQIDVGLF